MENLDTFFQVLLKDINTYLQSFWETITFEFVFKFGLIYFFVIWIALLVWVIKDISIRTDSVIFQILSVLIILFLTPFGIFIYLIIRPRKTLYEKYYDEIEDNLDIFHKLIEERKKEIDTVREFEKGFNSRKKDSLDKNKENISSEKKLKTTTLITIDDEGGDILKNVKIDDALEISNEQKSKEEEKTK